VNQSAVDWFSGTQKRELCGEIRSDEETAVPAFAFLVSAPALIYFARKFRTAIAAFPDVATYQDQVIAGADVLKTWELQPCFSRSCRLTSNCILYISQRLPG
jgi:hypothetical protein